MAMSVTRTSKQRPMPKRRKGTGRTIDPGIAGIDDGKRGASLASETPTEHAIFTQAELELEALDDWALQELMQGRNELEELVNERPPNPLEELVASLRKRRLSKLLRTTARLQNKKRIARDLHADRLKFQVERDVNRVPVEPNSKAWHYMTMYAVGVFEAAMNSVLFATSHPLGFTGGLATSMILSGLNIGAAVSAGSLLHWFRHPSTAIKAGCAVLLSIYFVALPMLHGIVGSYRDLLAEVAPEQAMLDAMPHFLSSPFALSLQSLILVGVGLLAAAVAIRKAYTAQDPIPGYSVVYARAEDALLDYQNELDEIRDELLGVVESSHDESQQLLDESSERCRRVTRVVGRMSRTTDDYDVELFKIERDREAALKAYYTSFVHAAGVGFAPPNRFDESPPPLTNALALRGFGQAEIEAAKKEATKGREFHASLAEAVTVFRQQLHERMTMASEDLDRFENGIVEMPDLDVLRADEDDEVEAK